MADKEEKKFKMTDENKKIFILVVAILVVLLLVYLIMNFLGNNKTATTEDLDKIVKDAQTTVLYVWNSDAKKCSNCKTIKKHLDKQKIDYMSYDVKNYSDKKYEKFLTSLTINPPDFNYPAIIYIKDGVMYSNIINIDNTKAVDTFIKEYKLTDLK